MPRQTSLRARGAAATADRVKPKDRPNPGRKKIDLLKTRIDAELDAELRGGRESIAMLQYRTKCQVLTEL